MNSSFVAIILASSLTCTVTTIGIYIISRYEEWGRANRVGFALAGEVPVVTVVVMSNSQEEGSNER